jgi:sugar transferase (PEP-CTERM system associated)
MIALRRLERRFLQLILLSADVLALILIFTLAQMIRFASSDAWEYFLRLFSDFRFLMIICLIIFANYIFDMYEPRHWRSRLFSPMKIFMATLTALVATFAWLYLLSSNVQGVVGRGVYLSAMGVYFFFSLFSRFFVDQQVQKKESKRQWLFIGPEDHLNKLKNDLKKIQIDGAVAWLNPNDHDSVQKFVQISSFKNELNGQEHVWAAIIVGCEPQKEITKQLMNARISGRVVLDIQSFYEFYCGKIPVLSLNDSWFAFTEGFSIIHSQMSSRIKRLFDLLISSFLLLLTAPLLLFSWMVIRLESRGAALYSQVRVGRNGQHFTMWKLRSMRIDAEKNGPQYASKNDNRITRFGRFMRKTRIDELPQLWNILSGEMSFIGPRPERPEFVDQLKQKIPFYEFRHLVKPGLSGWAQVMYPYGANDEDSLEKLQYDLFYIKNYSIELDLEIVVKTVSVVVFGAGR